MNLLKIFLLICFFSISPIRLRSQKKEINSVTALELRERVSAPDTFFVINFWATWCKPCVEELPELEKFSVNNTKQPVKVILVSLDFAEDLEKRLIPFVNEKKLTCEVFLLKDTNPNLFIPIINPNWTGSIPATWIIRNKKSNLFERKITSNELQEINNKK